MEYSKQSGDVVPDYFFDNVDLVLKDLYERKLSIEEVFSELNGRKNLSFMAIDKIDEDAFIKCFDILTNMPFFCIINYFMC